MKFMHRGLFFCLAAGLLWANTLQATSKKHPRIVVQLIAPTNGATVTDPVPFSASANSTNPIVSWAIYCENQNVYQVTNNSNTLAASVTLNPGTHSCSVGAWDTVANYGASAPVTFTVTDVAPPPPTGEYAPGIPMPPSTATTFTKVEDDTRTYWIGTSAEAGPTNVTNDFWTAPYQTTPSMDGSSREFHVGGPPWTAALFYHKMDSPSGALDGMRHYIWDFYVYVDSVSLDYVWTFEFDAYQALNGYEYMIGSHCSIGDGYWYGWNQAQGYWVKLASAPCRKTDWTPGVWHRVIWYVEVMPGTREYKYHTLDVDDRSYPLELVEPAGKTTWNNVMGVQWQVDTNSLGGTVNWWTDNVTLIAW